MKNSKFSVQNCLDIMAPLSEKVERWARFSERFPVAVMSLQLKLTSLHGRQISPDLTKRWVADTISTSGCTFGLFLLLAAASGDVMGTALAGLLFTALVPYVRIKRLDGAIKRKKRSILTELPEFINRLVLLVNAGETVQRALLRSIESAGGRHDHPFYKELNTVAGDLKNNTSLTKAMEDFSKRCAVQEISLFTTTLLLNYRRGGEDFVAALVELGRTLWEKRKSLAKTAGEEGSSKLVFPMVVIFLVITIIVASPAVMLMNNP